MEPGVCRQEGKASEYKYMVKIFFSFLNYFEDKQIFFCLQIANDDYQVYN